MHLAYFLLASHAEVLQDGRINMLGADTCVFFAETAPFSINSFSILTKVYFDPEERDREFPVNFQVVDPTGSTISATVYEGTCTPVRSEYPELPDHFGIAFTYQQFVFAQFGLHRAELRIGDSAKANLFILAKQK